VREVLCIQLEKDGSDTWRLEPVVELLKQGGVRRLLIVWGLAAGGIRQRRGWWRKPVDSRCD
jgi:hypothetical protein